MALDFDAKIHGADAVVDDVARMLQWLRECGGRAVVDVSSSGGRHVLVPLAPGKTVTADQVRPLLRLLAARLRTLDITPMTNPASGCITVPGSACKEGGHRRLVDVDPATAADYLTVGSDPGTLTRLEALLGGSSSAITHPVAAQIHTAAATERILGSGGETRLHPRFCRSTPPPAAVTEFAATGRRDRTRWPSRSEARQSVITHAVLAGGSPDDIVARAAAPDWAGLRAAYAHYAEPARAIRRDAAAALDWAASTLPDPVRDAGHKQKHTGGTTESVLRSWVTHAQTWVSREFISRRDRWTTHVVVQALAWAAAVSGQIVEGIPTVGVGGRSLSIAAGMLPESTVWSVLERLREMEGSPLLLIERGVGQNPDRYALVPTKSAQNDPERRSSGPAAEFEVEVESVHPAWSVLGWRQKMLYDTIAATETPMTAEELFTAVGIGRTSGYEALGDLRVAGLLVLDGAVVTIGAADLDDIGHRHGLTAAVRARIVRHRAERIVWREWLAAREDARTPPDPALSLFTVDDIGFERFDEDYLADVLDTGPPDH
ncbi:hypothetical protein HQ346_16995 [Rhodococcus sp. BP-252]|uniref:hypothetical protein n=1 Tax=unclassified Rhodococcus (in: high G+C Gram-positive bacteria) TaxID=192944 RepID=UPI001C9B3008|nr:MULTISPECIES: hypothetical protein [unclassified Rhodococcus (in: high G+C Gram-positive bacteria)]MBY6413394.1 hypothetical protein [Rhodococcus sp. BP-320]MBY6418002.1 hypothetical protein [Rhodococcus sp. BP-321]MBY6422308.1 hypothetical protein [Rhodococcus sp. BP-324]MBY6428051.1 hypothetical protein [Rhodococcus sp. BP-323]MBY6433315.1 hypothetical protein [Rhodococcus sp. BP-322]